MRCQKIWFLVLAGVLTLSLCFAGITPISAQDSEFFFSLTIVAPTNDETRVLYSQLIVNELSKIGINAQLALVGWDALMHRLIFSTTHANYAEGGFDIGLIDWISSIVPAELFQFFHSSNILSNRNLPIKGFNYYPVNNKTLDSILEFTMNTTDFNQRKEWIGKALKSIVWDIHPVTGIYQKENIFFMRDNIVGFDSNLFPVSELMSFSDGQSTGHGNTNELIIASPSIVQDFNPIISLNERFWYDDALVWRPLFAGLVERDPNLQFVPGIATQLPYPVAVKNNYTGELSSVDPNTATVWEVKLRENVFWHEGYGYRMNNATHRDILNFDADDVVWHYQDILLNSSTFTNLVHTDYQFVFGTEPDKAIIKVDQYTIQFHLQRTYADLFTLFDIVLPQHILDPNYDALGLGSGVRADGTSASVYKDWMMDDYNQGMRTSGDIQYPATIGTGAYMLYPGENRTENSVTLTTWNHYFKDTDTSYWAPLVANRPDKYKHDFIPNRDVANTMLDQGEIDIKCSQYQGEPYPIFGCSRPGVTVDKCLDWGYHTMGYNILHGADDHLTNKWVRLAISHVIPRQEIVDYVLGGLGQPSFVPFPQQSPYLPENLEPIKYNISRAFDYLERAEYDVTPFREDWIRQNPSVQSSNYVEVLFSSNLAFLGIIGIEIAIVVVLFMFIRRKRKN